MAAVALMNFGIDIGIFILPILLSFIAAAMNIAAACWGNKLCQSHSQVIVIQQQAPMQMVQTQPVVVGQPMQ